MAEVAVTGPCMACVVGLFEECHNPEVVEEGWIIPCAVRFKFIEQGDPVKKGSGRELASPSEITDPLSTGRKRAVIAMPIMTGMTCQWAGLRWAGGGIQPIVGCNGTTLAEVKRNEDLPEGIGSRGERHHGPDKAVLNNAPGTNLHGICSECHHRWHELNDPGYEGKRPEAQYEWLPSRPFYLHDPFTKATDEEYAASELWWDQDKKTREAYPVVLPPEDRLRYPKDESIVADDNPFGDDVNPFTEIGD